MKNSQIKTNAVIIMTFILVLTIFSTTLSEALTNHEEIKKDILIEKKPLNQTQYVFEPDRQYNFTSIWNNSKNITSVNITHNFEKNNTQTIPKKELENNTFTYNITGINAGIHEWSLTAKENNTNTTTTKPFYLIIEKKKPSLHFEISEKNLTETEKIFVNATLLEGEGNITFLVNKEVIQTSNKTIFINETPPHGEYNLTLKYEETQNYQSKNITKKVTVNKLKFEVKTSKEEYELGESGTFQIEGPSQANFTTRVLGPGCTPPSIPLEQKNTNELQGEIYTDEEGVYCVKTIMTFKNLTREEIIFYEVINNIDIRILGEKIVEPDQELKLKAEARYGFSPYTYTWKLDDGWQEVKGQELKKEFEDTGTYEIIVEVKDDKGNIQIKEIDVDVKNKYELDILVKAKDTGNSLENVEVLINDELFYTNSQGRITTELFEDDYDLEIIHNPYIRYRDEVRLDRDKEVTIELERRTQSQTTSTTSSNDINIISPEENSVLTTSRVVFEAEINPSSTAICKIYLAEENSEWFEELESYQVQDEEKISHTKNLEPGNYKWRVECSEEQNMYSSGNTNFEIRTSSVSMTSDVFDAGKIRQSLEDARDSMNQLSYEDEKSAKALDLHEKLRRALRDFDRNMRDINSMAFRRDLTQGEIDEKIREYTQNILDLERKTANSIKTLDSKTFIDYPDEDSIKEIAEEYNEEKNIDGRLDINKLNSLQNKIVVKTQILLSEITYLDGRSEEITIIHKEIEYKEKLDRTDFLLEKIPSGFGVNANDIVFFQEAEIIKNNPLIKLGAEDNITYYFPNHIQISDGEEIKTIVMSAVTTSSASTATRIRTDNVFTGMVTSIQTNLDAPIWTLIILLILIIAVLIHVFDFKKLFVRITSLGSKKQIQKINLLINDAQDYIDADNLERANFIFKEVKYNYEQSNSKVKKEVYEAAMQVYSELNKSFLIKKINALIKELNILPDKEVITKYNEIIEVYDGFDNKDKKNVETNIRDLVKIIQQQKPLIFN